MSLPKFVRPNTFWKLSTPFETYPIRSMKPNRHNPLFANIFRDRTRAAAIVVSLANLLGHTVAQATDIVWGTNVGAGPWVWNTGGNWTGGTAPVTNADRGDLRKDWTAAAAINLNAATTINGILFDDTGASGDVGVTIGNGGTAANTFTLSGTTPSIQVAGSTLTVSAIMAGSTAWSKTGGGTLILSGANTYTGGTAISAGILRASANSALGTGNVTFGSGATGRLQINNGVTVANNIVIDSGVSGTSGVGLIYRDSGTAGQGHSEAAPHP